jgi:hypothetical protein
MLRTKAAQKMDNTNTTHLKAVSLTVGNDSAPPRLTPGQFQAMLASLVKTSKRGGPDRVEIDSKEAPAVKPGAAMAWRHSVSAVDGIDGRWQDLDERAFEAKIEAAIALAREPEPEPAPEPETAPPRRRQRRPSPKYVVALAKCSGATSIDVPGGYRINLIGGSDEASPGGNPWDVVLPGAKNGSH